MKFRYLDKYAKFLLENHLEDFARYNIKLAFEKDIPLLKIFKNLSEEQLFQLARKGLEIYLKGFIQGTALLEIVESNEQWKAGQSPDIGREEVVASDIVLVHGLRKLSLVEFIDKYTEDLKLYKEINLEIENFYLEVFEISFRIFTEVQRDLLYKEKELTDTIINISEDSICAFDLDKKVMIWNNGFEKGTGIKKELILGKNIFDFFPHYKETPEGQIILKVLRGETVRLENMPYKDRSGFYEAHAVPLFNSKKEIIGGVTIVRDISERKQREELLIRNEERTRLLTSAVKDYAIYLLDPTGHVMTWNEGAKRMKGYTEEEIIGKHFSIFYPTSGVGQSYPDYELKKALEEGRFEDESWRVRKDGSKFWANAIITPLYNKDKELIGFSKITRDLTERRQIEDKLQQYNNALEATVTERTEALSRSIDELKKINADLDNFVYTASHDLKAPISNLEGLIMSLYDELSEETKSKKTLSEIKQMVDKSISRFKGTIEDLTQISRIQKNVDEDVEEINIEETIEEIRDLIGESIKATNARIRIKPDGCRTIKFSKRNFKSVLYNLISNAIKYRAEERVPSVEVRCSQEKEYIVIEIRDNGLGIAPQHMERLFTMFRRFHDHVEGTGIGLYIVKRIVENAGGKIEVESELGKGSVFRVYFKKQQ